MARDMAQDLWCGVRVPETDVRAVALLEGGEVQEVGTAAGGSNMDESGAVGVEADEGS